MAKQKRILVVDDDPGIRDYLEALFTRQGLSASSVATGEEVIEALESQETDLVILDLILPGINGLEVFKLVKERWPDLPILMLSGQGQARTIVEAMRLGAADFLRKPFEVEELETILNAILDAEGRTRICPTCSGAGRVEA